MLHFGTEPRYIYHALSPYCDWLLYQISCKYLCPWFHKCCLFVVIYIGDESVDFVIVGYSNQPSVFVNPAKHIYMHKASWRSQSPTLYKIYNKYNNIINTYIHVVNKVDFELFKRININSTWREIVPIVNGPINKTIFVHVPS